MRSARVNRFFYAELNNYIYRFISLSDRNDFCKMQNAKIITQKEMFNKLEIKNLKELKENYSVDIGIDNNPFFIKK